MPPDPAPRDASSAKTMFKVAVPLAVLLAVVFGVTFFKINTPPEDTGPQSKTKTAEPSGGKGLVFYSATRRWDPSPDASPADQVFPGFFEPGEQTHATHFWFENRNPSTVTMQLVGVSCSACSGGRVAAVPPDAARALLQMAAVSALPLGPIAACPPGMAGAGAYLNAKLEWQAHLFKDGPKDVKYVIPGAAPGPWAPAWGILELNFKVRPNPQIPLRAVFASGIEGGEFLGRDEFSIYFEPAAAFDVDKSAIDAGVLADNTPAQTSSVVVYSSARGQEDLAGVVTRVIIPGGDDAGPFVTTGPPVPVPAAELDRIAAGVSAKSQKSIRVRAAVRVPVTVAAKVGAARADIGRLDREVWVTVPGISQDVRKVAVKAAVVGPVSVAGGNEINLGTFKQRDGASETVVVTTDDAKLDLAVAPGATPDYLDVALKKQPDAGARGQWQLTVRVPPGRVVGAIPDGLVVLELKGPTPIRVRVPVKGQGVF